MFKATDRRPVVRLRCVGLVSAVAVSILATTASAAERPGVFPGRDWQQAEPASQGVDPQRLSDALAYLKQHSGADGTGEVVIIRNGYLIWRGENIDKVHGVWSCTKSFTSTVLGLLIDDGKSSLDTRAARYVPAMARHYPDVTLRHFATMTSGYRAAGDEPRGGYTHGPSATPFVPGDSPLFPPGSQYAYWDSAMNLFALVLTQIAGEPMEGLFRRRIAEPIGMDPKQWSWGRYAVVDGLVVNGGSGNADKHVRISARQMARFGLLFLHKGHWNGRQLLSPGWVEAATSVQVPAATPWGHPASEIDGRGVYGYNWWPNGLQPNGQRKWPDAPPGTFAASGHNNNKLFVLPEWNMVIVRLGLDQKDGKISDEVWSRFLGKVGEAISARNP